MGVFQILEQKQAKLSVPGQNTRRKAKFKRGIRSLHNIGIKATWKKVFSYLYGTFIRFTTV